MLKMGLFRVPRGGGIWLCLSMRSMRMRIVIYYTRLALSKSLIVWSGKEENAID
jgi:hypothetical protein